MMKFRLPDKVEILFAMATCSLSCCKRGTGGRGEELLGNKNIIDAHGYVPLSAQAEALIMLSLVLQISC